MSNTLRIFQSSPAPQTRRPANDRCYVVRDNPGSAAESSGKIPSPSMPTARRRTARRSNLLISQANIEARIETEANHGYYWPPVTANSPLDDAQTRSGTYP